MSKNTPERRAARAARAAEALKAQQAAERKRKMMIIGGVVVAVALIIGGGFLLQSMRDTTGQEARDTPTIGSSVDETETGETPGEEMPSDETPGEIDGFGVVIGDPDAADTVTIYEDLQCPACANLETQVGPALNAAIDAGAIKVDYRIVAFLNDYSVRGMNALLVVLEEAGPDAFRTMHDALYANQPTEGGGGGLDDDALVEYAVEAGAAEEDVRPAIEGKVYEQWITNATDQMSKDGVNSTPTIRINGEDADPQQLVSLLQQQG